MIDILEIDQGSISAVPPIILPITSNTALKTVFSLAFPHTVITH